MLCPVCQSDDIRVYHSPNRRDVETEKRLLECQECKTQFWALQKLSSIRQGKKHIPIEEAEELISTLQKQYYRNIENRHNYRQFELWQR